MYVRMCVCGALAGTRNSSMGPLSFSDGYVVYGISLRTCIYLLIKKIIYLFQKNLTVKIKSCVIFTNIS